MNSGARSTDGRDATGSAPVLASNWTTLAGLRCHAIVSMRPAPARMPQIVLVHGFGASSSYMIPTARAMAGRFAVFAPDLPGYGLSDAPERVLDVPDLARCLADWLAQQHIERAVLVGNSFGCQIIAALATQSPELVSHAILIGPTADVAARTMGQLAWRLLRDAFYEPFSLWLLQSRDYLRFGPRWQWQTAKYMLADRIEDRLPKLAIPVLILRGEHDPIATDSWCRRLARLAPYGSMTTVAGEAHAVNYTSPMTLVAEIERFLASWESGQQIEYVALGCG